MSDASASIDGLCDPRFAPVREAFRDNFEKRGEPGAALAVSLDGRPVVDLWGGWADRARSTPWQRDTLVNVFSVSKAFCAICALRLVERGLVDLDAPLAECWPEFAACGKETITLRHVLSHRAGMAAVRRELPDGAALEWETITRALAEQKPWWEPGRAHGYHVNTFGFLVGEVVRRVTGKTLGTMLREEIARPLGADIHIGLAAREHSRVAEFLWPSGTLPRPSIETDLDLMRWNAYWNPPGISGSNWVNKAAWRLAEIPSTNGHATARGIARVYAALANWGAIDGIRILDEPTLHAALIEHSNGTDLVSGRQTCFGLGFQLTHPERPLGPNAGAFGHFGAGGALGFCDPDADIAFGYVTCDMGPRWQNPRNRALIDAVFGCV
ncbi:MAG TPA: serine hydrolase domain-containing protein [Rhizomicrobium sp.]|jgi:CubicO group peptidase (beta-lactamase class C family)